MVWWNEEVWILVHPTHCKNRFLSAFNSIATLPMEFVLCISIFSMTLELSRSWRNSFYFAIESTGGGNRKINDFYDFFNGVFVNWFLQNLPDTPHISTSRAYCIELFHKAKFFPLAKKLIVLSWQCEQNNECKGSSNSEFIFPLQFGKIESTLPSN